MTEPISISRRGFLAAGSSLALAHGAAAARPNVLYIMTDQQHAAMMSCTGNRWLKTPAMDSLAGSGMRFECAYTSNPVCTPARTSMMTGRYPSYFGMDGNGSAQRPPKDLSFAMGNLFRAAGYRTVYGGKTHWPAPMTPKSVGFEYLTYDERDQLADKCADFLAQEQDKPFLLVASFINPHDISMMSIDYYTKAEKRPELFPNLIVDRKRANEAMTLPLGVSRQEFFARHCPPLPPNHEPTSGEPGALAAERGEWIGYVRRHWTEEDWRLHRWAYCRLTERVDTEIGRVLAALRRSGLDRNTLVIFSADHGDMDSAHRFESKSLPYEEAARVPFIVSFPERVPAGTVDRRHLVSASVDLLPTLCDFAGIEAPTGLPGRSVKAIASGKPPAHWRDDLLVEFFGGRSVRSARYKYSVWNAGMTRERRFDIVQDPGEMKNLVDDASMASVLEDHRERLRRQIAAVAGPPA